MKKLIVKYILLLAFLALTVFMFVLMMIDMLSYFMVQ